MQRLPEQKTSGRVGQYPGSSCEKVESADHTDGIEFMAS